MNIAAITNGIIAPTKTNGNYHTSINSDNSKCQQSQHLMVEMYGYWEIKESRTRSETPRLSFIR